MRARAQARRSARRRRRRRHARVRLRHARAVEEAGLASDRRSWCRFSRPDYKSPPPTSHASAAAQSPVVPAPPARSGTGGNGRDLPWRQTTDPYHILVSEVMLQQTQVDRVLPKYHEWLGKYPTLQALADAPEEDVAQTWRPLGYNIRPRRLHAIARESVLELRRRAALRRRDAAVVQGDRRVHGRGGPQLRVRPAQGDPRHERRAGAVPGLRRRRGSKGARDAASPVEVSRTVLPMRHVFDFNQALMDFGATLCTARKPKCADCPMQNRLRLVRCRSTA